MYVRNCPSDGIKSAGFFQNSTAFFLYHLISLLINYLFNRNDVESIFDERKV